MQFQLFLLNVNIEASLWVQKNANRNGIGCDQDKTTSREWSGEYFSQEMIGYSESRLLKGRSERVPRPYCPSSLPFVWLRGSCFVAPKALHTGTEQPQGTKHFTAAQ